MLHSYETPEFWWVTNSLTPIVVKLLNLIYNTLTFHYVLEWEFISLVLRYFRRDTMDLWERTQSEFWVRYMICRVIKQLGSSGSAILGVQNLGAQWRHENIMLRWYQNQPLNRNNILSPDERVNVYVTALRKQQIEPDHPQENDLLCCRLARYLNSFGVPRDNISFHGYGPLLTSLDDCFGFICPLRSII